MGLQTQGAGLVEVEQRTPRRCSITRLHHPMDYTSADWRPQDGVAARGLDLFDHLVRPMLLRLRRFKSGAYPVQFGGSSDTALCQCAHSLEA